MGQIARTTTMTSSKSKADNQCRRKIQTSKRIRQQKNSMPLCYKYALLALLASLLARTISANSITSLGTVIAPEACYNALARASSGDNQLTAPEFVEFLEFYSVGDENNDFFQSVDEYAGLPLQAIYIFNIFADSATYIDITGAAPGETPSTAQEVKLYEICKDSINMIEAFVPPTNSPTTEGLSMSPTISTAPSSSPITTTPADKDGTEQTTATTTSPPPATEPSTPSPLSVSYSFIVGVGEDISSDGFLNGQAGRDLVTAFDPTMEVVLKDLVDNLRLRGRRLAGRMLDLTHDSTAISAVESSTCPDNTPEGTFCHIATVDMKINGGDVGSITEADVAERTDEAVADGTFAGNLPSDSLITYTSPIDDLEAKTVNSAPGVATNNDPDALRGESAGLSMGAVVGIAIGSLATLCVAVAGLFISRRNRRDKQEEQALPGFNASRVDDCGRSRGGGGNARLGATSPNYGGNIMAKSQVRGFNTLDEDDDEEDTSTISDEEELVMRPPVGGARRPPLPPGARSIGSRTASSQGGRSRDDPYYDIVGDASISVDSSSNAGSSGWSSSAGLSSLNTQSVEDSLDFEKNRVSTLAAIGVASGKAGRMQSSPLRNQQRVPRLTSLNERDANGASGTRFVPMLHDGNSTIESDTFSASSNPLNDNKMMERGSVPSLPQVTRNDLDSAIEAGDWAAVGATAALLATVSDAASNKSFNSQFTRSTLGSKASNVSSIDAARAAELDNLVDAGDWEGVVLAAAKFEASSDRDNDTTASKSITSEVYSARSAITDPSGTGTSSVGTSSAYSTGFSTSVSESPSKAQKRAEIRVEVEALVRRVVPDEIDNVDEMMLQFNGREEELVETLRTMQERSIAQRARAAVHRSAKREARRTRSEHMPPLHTAPGVQQADRSASVPPELMSGGNERMGVAAGVVGAGALAYGVSRGMENDERNQPQHDTFEENSQDLPETHPDSQFVCNPSNAGISNGTENDRPGPPSPNTPSQGSGSKENVKPNKYNSTTTSPTLTAGSRTALELAIEAGDWEAVGEAAAMMSDASATTMSTRDMSGPDYDSSFSGMKNINANRAATLDKLIDKGDWTGVVAAASHFSESDRGLITKKGASSNMNTSSGALTASTGKTPLAERENNNRGPYQSAKRTTMEVVHEYDSGEQQNQSESSQPEDNPDDETMSSESVVIKKDQALREEQDALAQAEIWLKIAEQSKQGGGAEAKGASDAADWAISRSLSALHSAERGGELTVQPGRKGDAPISSSSQASVGSSKCDKSV